MNDSQQSHRDHTTHVSAIGLGEMGSAIAQAFLAGTSVIRERS